MLEEVQNIINTIISGSMRDDDWFPLFKKISKSIENEQAEALKILVYLLQYKSTIPSHYVNIFTSLLEDAGFFPYIEKEKQFLAPDKITQVSKYLHKSDYVDGYYLHKEQKEIEDLIFNTDSNIILSAPTSFGKSLLIQEVVASGKYKNIIIIQPTLALLSETRLKLTKYRDTYNIILRTTQRPSEDKGNLFLLTAERFLEYEDMPKIDFLILDEFYKISRWADKERFHNLNIAVLKLLKEHKARFYFLGPFINSISSKFIDSYNVDFIETQYSLVQAQETFIYEVASEKKFFQAASRSALKKQKLFDILYKLKGEQTIIYCSSPDKVYTLAKEFLYYIKAKLQDEADCGISPLEEWIENQTRDNDRNLVWDIKEIIHYGIGLHNASLPRHLIDSIINYFNKGKLNFLFCTSTIIEGVNTNAKNIIIYDGSKGGAPLTFFDYSNIKGRAGRLMKHYIGNVYSFVEPPVAEVNIVDIPFSEQSDLDKEILIHLDDEDILDKESANYDYINSLPNDEKELFKKNGVNIEGQKAILNYLERHLSDSNIFWSGVPDYDKLRKVLELAWDNLMSPTESKAGAYTSNRLAVLVLKYYQSRGVWGQWRSVVEENVVYKYNTEVQSSKNSMKAMPPLETIYNESIGDSFKAIRHWFEYKVPKWLRVMSEIQKFVAHKYGIRAGDYSYFAGLVEGGGINDKLTILLDYGIPRTAIEKIDKHIPKDIDESQVLNWVIEKQAHFDSMGLIEYEKERLKILNYNNR